MYKKIVKILSCFIINKQKRHEFRYKYENFYSKKKERKTIRKYGNYYLIDDFYKYRIKPKSVLILEFNDFHGITLPGYVNYFKKLGYNIDLFLRPGQNVKWMPLVRLQDDWTAFIGQEGELATALRNEKINEYDFVFLNTTFYYGFYSPYPNAKSVLSIIEKMPKGKYGTIMIEHNYEPFVKCFREYKYICNGNLFTLLGFRNTKMLSSSYVGKVNITDKNEDIVKFLVAGTIHAGNKNFNMLISACEKLIKEGKDNFEIGIIGAGKLKNIPKCVRKHIKKFGTLSYKKMYEKIEDSDFIFTLFDPDIKEHKKYIDNWASGTSILVYAFAKPCLIHKKFAPSYFLTDKNSIVYEDSLYQAMKEALKMPSEIYKEKQKSLQELQFLLQKQSLKNLKEQIEKMEECKFCQ